MLEAMSQLVSGAPPASSAAVSVVMQAGLSVLVVSGCGITR